MHVTQLLLVVVCTLACVNAAKFAANSRPFLDDQTSSVPTETTTLFVTITVPTFDTVTHTLNVATTRDVRVTDTFNTAQVFTVDTTVFNPQAGRPNVQTSVVGITSTLLRVETVRDNTNLNTAATVTSTVFSTTTQVETSTLRITHVDNVLEETVVPRLSVLNVEQVETTTVTATVTEQVTRTVTPLPLEPVFSQVTRTVVSTGTTTVFRTIPSTPQTFTVTRTVTSTRPTTSRPTGYLPPQ